MRTTPLDAHEPRADCPHCGKAVYGVASGFCDFTARGPVDRRACEVDGFYDPHNCPHCNCAVAIVRESTYTLARPGDER